MFWYAGVRAHRTEESQRAHANRHEPLQSPPGPEAAFEYLWTRGDTPLKEVPGFVEFRLLCGPQREGEALYASHTRSSDHLASEGWAGSEVLLVAHRNAGNSEKASAPLCRGHPDSGFDAVHAVRYSSSPLLGRCARGGGKTRPNTDVPDRRRGLRRRGADAGGLGCTTWRQAPHRRCFVGQKPAGDVHHVGAAPSASRPSDVEGYPSPISTTILPRPVPSLIAR
jgi:heme-degrading monooxygenase HmoA